VRAALARRLADIGELAVHFLDLVALGSGEGAGADICSYDTEVAALHDILSQAVTLLLEDPVNSVKQVLVHYGAARLAVFFGRQRANDVLLSHMITFLNDKEDSQLRYCFFDNIAGVAAFVGWQCSAILKPLLQQGLADPEEFVVARAINAIASLTRQGLLEKVGMFDMLRDSLPFLMHPNLWIRQATVGLVEAMASRLDTVDIQVYSGLEIVNE
jgi:phosphoinositide-3-kinase regulatory subunit 4